MQNASGCISVTDTLIQSLIGICVFIAGMVIVVFFLRLACSAPPRVHNEEDEA